MAQNSRAIRSIIFLSAIFGSVFHLAASTPVLEWDPNTEPSIAGYKFYSGEKSHVYDRVIDVGNNTSVPLADLGPGITYYFAITAYTTNLLESPLSEEISYTTQIDGVTAAVQPCALKVANGTAKVSFPGKAWQFFWVEATSDFQTWELIEVSVPGFDGIIELTGENVSDRPMRFYRVVMSSP
jgi:hypothetical protein